MEEASHYQTIAATISGTADESYPLIEIDLFGHPISKNGGGSVHEVSGRDGFILYGVLIPIGDLLRSEYFHPWIALWKRYKKN
jgi:hypothetical protein